MIPWVRRFPATAQQKKPNINVIFGDDIAIWSSSAYHRGMMGDRVIHDTERCR
jgi:hypothetical protein